MTPRSRPFASFPRLAWLAAVLMAAAPRAQPPASAEPARGVVNPYAATVPVADQSAQARAQALRHALQVVMTNVSGGTPASRAQLGDASALVRQYGYVRDPSGAGLMLQAEFDPRAIDTALRDRGLPVFGVGAGSVDELVILVAEIAGARDYSRALACLRGIPGVQEVRVVEVGGGAARFEVRVEGGEGRIAGAVAVGDVLVRDDVARYRLAR